MVEDSYEPLSIEQKWQSEWELKNQFKPVESDKQFSIVIPVSYTHLTLPTKA